MGEAMNGAPNAVDRRIGERVRARPLEICMSQGVLADRLGITSAQKYEEVTNRIAASDEHARLAVAFFLTKQCRVP